jgi:ribonuclease HI
MCNYVSRILALRKHPCFNIITKPQLLDIFNRRRKATRPLPIRFHDFIASNEVNLPKLCWEGFSEIPPWKIPKPEILTDLASKSKAETNPREYNLNFLELCNNYPNAVRIFTDGSKSNTNTACAAVSKIGTYAVKMHPYCGIYVAELLGIKTALKEIKSRNTTFLLCTDSRSALSSIRKVYPTHPLVQDIQSLLFTHRNLGNSIVFVWVPGHTGIRGNELADSTARRALCRPVIDYNLVTSADLKTHFRELIRSKWKELWHNTTNNKLRGIKEVTSAWPTSIRSCRREEVVLTRLRIGHCALTHAYLFTAERIPPRCDICDMPLTVKHLLVECIKYRDLREKYRLMEDLHQLLGNEPDMINQVLKFLTFSGLFHLI